jgi:hypothetical protein
MIVYHLGIGLSDGMTLAPDFNKTRALIDPFLTSLSRGEESFQQLLLHARYVRALMRKSGLREWSNCSKWATEAVFEIVRMREFPVMPSRLESCFFFDDRAKSEALFIADYLEPGDDEGVDLFEVDLDDDRPALLDMGIYDQAYSALEESSDLAAALSAARRYWSLDRTPSPTLEIVSRGRATILSRLDVRAMVSEPSSRRS